MSKSTIIPIGTKHRISISHENTKLGKIPSFSLPPGKTCSKEACKTCFLDGCYAVKAYKLYPSTRAAWDGNLAALKADPAAVEDAILKWLKTHKPRFFRIHTSGDFFSGWYLFMWQRIIAACPETMFLAFSKQFVIMRAAVSQMNFQLFASGWTGIKIPEDIRRRFPVADCITRDMVEPNDAVACPGSCKTCVHCYTSGTNVYFHKH